MTAQWWIDHDAGGVIQDGRIEDDDWDRAERLNETLEAKGEVEVSLIPLIEALVLTAPRTECLPYIGTWFLENAYPSLGERVFDALECANVTAAQRALIRSGFQW
jgi:hypothetical protein